MDNQLFRRDVFGLPIWQLAVPEFVPHHKKLVTFLQARYKKGEFNAHKFGYGYQAKEDFFLPSEIKKHPHFSIIKYAFLGACNAILNERKHYSTNMDYELSQTQAWLLLQTREGWDVDRWHNHYPAVLSATYCVQMPNVKTEGEGLTCFKSPQAPSALCEPHHNILPKEGTMIIFPSFLDHRPSPSPSADKYRVTLNMDAFVTWRKKHRETDPDLLTPR